MRVTGVMFRQYMLNFCTAQYIRIADENVSEPRKIQLTNVKSLTFSSG